MAIVDGKLTSQSGTGIYSDDCQRQDRHRGPTPSHRLHVDDTGTIGGIKVESDSSQA